jgi:hypothetical protein
MDPRARLLELDERCRQVLYSNEFSIRRQFSEIHREIDRVRNRHPNLTQRLEALYHEVYPNRPITTMGLISFAIERKLRLTGDSFLENTPSP